MLVVLQAIGMFTSSCQKILVFRTKDNVTLSVGLIILELSICASCLLFIFSYTSDGSNTLLSDVCGPIMKLDQGTMARIDFSFGILDVQEGELDIRLIISTIIVQMVFISVIML
jgi:hypothetical protein